MADRFATHGRILCGTVVTPDLRASLADYTGALGLQVVEEGPVPETLATSWGAPATAMRPHALLLGGPEDSFLRLVEGSPVSGHAAMRGIGWLAWELTVRDAFALREGVRGSGFTVIGEPQRVEGFDSFIPFQVSGRGGETLYLNQVLEPEADGVALPHARADVDRIFIAVAGARDRAGLLHFCRTALGLEQGGDYVIPLGVLNRAYGLPDDARQRITMTKVGRLPVFEVDQLPDGAGERAQAPGELPPGCAFPTIAVDSLDRIDAPFVGKPARRIGALYRDRRAATVIGPDNLLIELVEA